MELKADIIRHANGVGMCENLRLADKWRADSVAPLRGQGAPLVPVGDPAMVMDDGWQPFARLDEGFGVFVKGSEYRIADDEGIVSTEGSFSSPPLTSLGTPEGLMIMLDDAEGASATTVVLTPDGVTEVTGAEGRVPLSLTSIDSAEIMATGGQIPVSGSYGRNSSRLAPADATRLSDSLLQAYCRMDSHAMSAGAYLQPMVGYYRLLDGMGRERYRSMPVVLGAAKGLNGLDDISIGMGQGEQIGNYTISATSYRVALRLDCDPADVRAMAPLLRGATIEVCLSPQVHPVDFSATAEARVEHPDDTHLHLTCHLPGTSSGMNAHDTAGAPGILAILSHLDEAVVATARINVAELGLSAAGDVLALSPLRTMGARREVARINSLAAKSVRASDDTAASMLLERCRLPHRFAAHKSAVAGSTVMWGDITTHLFAGYMPTEMARTAAVAPSAVRATTDVPGSDGVETPVAELDECPLTPTALSPLICYPLRAATRIMIDVTAQGTTRRVTAPLRTVPGCPYAFMLSPTLRPMPVSEGDALAALPDIGRQRMVCRHAGAVITAPLSSPLDPVGAAIASAAPIQWLMAATRSISGWNFAHTRFYLFSGDGVMSLAVNGKLAPGAAVLLHEGGIKEGTTPFRGDSGTVYAVCGDTLVAFDGGKARAAHIVAASAGYCRQHREIWVTEPKECGGTTKIYESSLRGYYIRRGLDIDRLTTVGDRLYAITSSGRVLDTTREACLDLVPTAWSRRIALPRPKGYLPGRRRTVTLTCDIAGELVAGSLSAMVDNGTDTPVAVAVEEISGPLRGPLTLRLMIPDRRYLTVAFNGRVSSDFEISLLSI